MTMLNLLNKLRQDENGVILSAELVIIGSLLVVGMITGLTCLQQSVNGELRDVAGAIGSLDQSYAFSAHRKPGTNGQCCAWTAGSSFTNCERKQEECVNDVVGCQDILIETRTDCCQGGTAGCTGCGQCGGGSAEGGVSGCGGCGGCVPLSVWSSLHRYGSSPDEGNRMATAAACTSGYGRVNDH